MITALPDMDFESIDLGIRCEFPCCTAAAVVMSKGCADERHAAICDGHLRQVQARFESLKPAVCSACHRPFMFFETHYDLVNI